MRWTSRLSKIGISLAVLLWLFYGNLAAQQKDKTEKAKFKTAEDAYRAGLARDAVKSRWALEEALRLAPDAKFKLKVYQALKPIYRASPESDKMVEALEFIIANSDSAAERHLTCNDLLSFVRQRGKIKELAAREEERLKNSPSDRMALQILSDLYDRYLPNHTRCADVTALLLAVQEKRGEQLDLRIAAHLGQQYVWAGKWKEGAEQFEKIAPLDSKLSAWHWKEAAHAWLKAKDYDKARIAAKASASASPEKRSAQLTRAWHTGLADVLLYVGELPLAIEHFEIALATTDTDYIRDEIKGKLAEARGERPRTAPRLPLLDIQATITDVKMASDVAKINGTLGWIVVQEDMKRAPNIRYGETSIRITTKTTLVKLDGKQVTELKFDELKKGDQLNAFLADPMADTYPVQATGRRVAVVPKTGGLLSEIHLSAHYAKLGRWADAAESYGVMAAAGGKQSAWNWKEAAEAWLKAKNKEQARAAAKAASKSPPEKRTEPLNFDWHKGVADVFLQTGEPALAIAHYEKALDHTDSQEKRRDCLGRIAEARAALTKSTPAETFDIEGSITSVKLAGPAGKKDGVLGWIIVKSNQSAKPGTHDLASVRITTKTSLIHQVGSKRQPASFDDLREGASIQVRFIGGVDDSFPVQATGGAIVLLRPKQK